MHPRITKSQSQRNTSLQIKGNFRNFKNQQLYIILGFLDLLKTQERALSDWTVFLLTHPMVMMKPALWFEAFRKSCKSALTVMIFDADGAAKVGLTYSSPHPTTDHTFKLSNPAGGASIQFSWALNTWLKVLHSNFNSNPELKLGALKGSNWAIGRFRLL